MKSSPVEESRRLALEAAEQLIENDGWKNLTAAKIAEVSGMSRQWLHALFGGQEGLIDALVNSLAGHWKSSQIEIIAARLPLAETTEKSFTILLESSPALSIVFRQIMVDRATKFENIWNDVERIWSPVWQGERRANVEENTAVSAIFFSSALGLELLVRRRELKVSTAKYILLAAIRGCLQRKY